MKNGQILDSSITVVVAEDSESVRKALVSVISASENLVVVGEACDGREAVERTIDLRPSVLTLDIAMPGLNGLEVTKELHLRGEKVRILAVSLIREPEYVRQMMNFGAMGYILKEEAHNCIVTAINAVSAGNNYLSPEIRHLLPIT